MEEDVANRGAVDDECEDSHLGSAFAADQGPGWPRFVTTDAFRDVPESIGYPEAGAFSHFLIREHGISRLLDFFRVSHREASIGQIREHFRESFGTSLDAAEREWHSFLGR